MQMVKWLATDVASLRSYIYRHEQLVQPVTVVLLAATTSMNLIVSLRLRYFPIEKYRVFYLEEKEQTFLTQIERASNNKLTENPEETAYDGRQTPRRKRSARMAHCPAGRAMACK
jgi:hypothetical protein